MKIFRKSHLYIYTDGSSLPKPRRGGIGIRYLYLDESEEEHIIDLELEETAGATNNQMELWAVIEGIKNSPYQDIPINYSVRLCLHLLWMLIIYANRAHMIPNNMNHIKHLNN